MSICKIGSNTKDTVVSNFQTNMLVAESPSTSGDYLVLKPAEFDRANAELSDDLFQSYNLLGTFWVRTGNQARFNNVLAELTDIVIKRQSDGNEQYTNDYTPPVSPKAFQDEADIIETEGLPTIEVPREYKNPCA